MDDLYNYTWGTALPRRELIISRLISSLLAPPSSSSFSQHKYRDGPRLSSSFIHHGIVAQPASSSPVRDYLSAPGDSNPADISSRRPGHLGMRGLLVSLDAKLGRQCGGYMGSIPPSF